MNELQALVGGAWKSVAHSSTIGRKRIKRFTPIRTDQVCLRTLEADAVPVIRFFAAYNTQSDHSSY